MGKSAWSPTEILLSASVSLVKKRLLLMVFLGARKVKPHKIWRAPRAKTGKKKEEEFGKIFL